MLGPDMEMNHRNSDQVWYALYTRNQHEKLAARILTNKGFDIFLPLYTAGHKWQDRVKQVSLPLFPGYLFIQGGLDRWLQIMTTPGVCSVVGYGGKPSEIPGSEIEGIQRMVESALRVEPHPFLKTGDWVRVKSGALVGLEGILIRKKNLTRLVLSVEMLGKSASVEVDIATVERIPVRGQRRRFEASAPLARESAGALHTLPVL
jgi:transcription antitermination factor NusG